MTWSTTVQLIDTEKSPRYHPPHDMYSVVIHHGLDKRYCETLSTLHPSPTLVCPTPNHQEAVSLIKRGSWPHTLLLPSLLEKHQAQPHHAGRVSCLKKKISLAWVFRPLLLHMYTAHSPPCKVNPRSASPPPPSHDIKPSNFNVTEYQHHNRKVHRCNALLRRSRDRRCRIIGRVTEQVLSAGRRWSADAQICWP